MPNGPILDPEAVAELRRAQEAYGSPDFIRQLVAIFQANAPGKIDRIREALKAGDAATVELVAHALKTNCAMLGARQMADACARMEAASRRADAGGLEEAAAAFTEAEALLPGVLAAIAAIE